MASREALAIAEKVLVVRDESVGHVLYLKLPEFSEELDSWESPASAWRTRKLLVDKLARLIDEGRHLSVDPEL